MRYVSDTRDLRITEFHHRPRTVGQLPNMDGYEPRGNPCRRLLSKSGQRGLFVGAKRSRRSQS
jgi:hypothetical protein